jgi:hypothetical protein
MDEAAMLEFLVQAVCVDAAGRANGALPGEPDCRATVPQTPEMKVPWRRHDWPDAREAVPPAAGYQASDSVLGQVGGRDAVVQSFDFGDALRRFGRFDGGLGDGGQVAVLSGGWASLVFTEDGGGGRQWFVGPGCRFRRESRHRAWLLFDAEVGPAWREAEARLVIAASPTSCPRRLNAALTRFRRAAVQLPFRRLGAGGAARMEERTVDAVISEHFGGAAVAEADHVERFVLGRGFGLLRWERWANFGRARNRALGAQAAGIALSRRCPATSEPFAAADKYRLVDCRTWTTLVPSPGWRAADFAWPVADALGPVVR